MPSDKDCCVPGCNCKHSDGTMNTLHKFPNPEKDRTRFNLWLYAIGGDILALQNEHIFKYRRVCNSHFEDKYLCRNKRISNIAVPRLNIPGPFARNSTLPSERRRLQQVENIAKPSTSTGLFSINSNLPFERIPLQQVENIAKPSTSKDFHQEQRHYSLTDVEKVVEEKENIDPELMIIEPVSSPPLLNESQNKILEGKKYCKRRLFSKVEEVLYKKLVAAKVKLSKIKHIKKKQSTSIKLVKNIATNPHMINAIQNSTSTAKLLIQMQWRENKKKLKGHRFTLDEKIASLSIYKQSPKGYRFLRKIFILPAQQTLIKLIQKSNIKPGLNKNIFSQLKNKASTMKLTEKLCIILFDEMSLKPSIMFNERKEFITGFVDNGLLRKPDFANHAQVFMVRGLIYNYKQPIAYTFSSSATKGPELANQLKLIIKEVQEAGFIVTATVCDQGTNNRQALRLLINETRGDLLRQGEEPKHNIIVINGQEIIPLYDPPHLLKGIRNNLLTKDLLFKTKEGHSKLAKWSHLEQLYRQSPSYRGLRLIPKLTEYHINPLKINKMKVKFAAQIFSFTVGANLGFLAEKGYLPSECMDTADLVITLDRIFDSVNGSFKKNINAKPLLGPVKPNSVHYKIWKEAIEWFKTMKFINSSGKAETIPTIENWVWTLNGIIKLLEKIRIEYGVTSLWMRHLNQDPLENFFGAVRSHGCRNNNPTCEHFQSIFATLLINNINSVHTRGNNCEGDFCKALYNIIINDNEETTSASSFDFTPIVDYNFTPLEHKINDARIEGALQYVSGYFLKKTKKNIFKNCQICNTDFSSERPLQYIERREYAGRRWLCTPSNNFILLISNIQDIINYLVKEIIDETNLYQIMKTSIIVTCNFNFINCNEHKEKIIDYVSKIAIRCLIHNYCKNINLILAGRREIDDDDDKLQIKAKKINMCYKRLRCQV